MTSKKSFLVLALVAATFALPATEASAQPLICGFACNDESPCDQSCRTSAGVGGIWMTCGEWGVCDWGGFVATFEAPDQPLFAATEPAMTSLASPGRCQSAPLFAPATESTSTR